jgi:hypothetical protein
VADWRGLLDALSYTGPGAINSLARNTANSLMSGEDPAYRYQMLPFTEDKLGNTSFGIPQMGMDIFESLNRVQDQAQGRLDEDGNPITTRGLDAINVAGIAPLGGIAAGGGKALAAGLAANRAEASAAPLAMDQASRLSRARDMGFDTDATAYRGLTRPYNEDEASKLYYQMFTSSPAEAGEYAMGNPMARPNVMPAYLRKGNNLEVDARSANFNAIPTDGLPDGIRARLRGDFARTDEIAHAARELGYDSATIRNVIDNATNEKTLPPQVNPQMQAKRDEELDALLAELGIDDVNAAAANAPVRGYEGVAPYDRGPVTIDAIFDPRNIRSVNATFDPSKSDSANLLAANSEKAAAPLALNALEGQPIRAYRGMQMDRQQGAKSDTMFGSSDPEVAASYANQVEDPRFGSSFESGAMMPLDMNFNNPMRVDAGGNYWSEIPYNGDFASTDQLVSKARALGHDGLIVDNVKDALTRGSEPATTYAAIGRGTVRSPLTGETLFSNPDEAVPLSLGLNALDQQAPDQIDINELLRRYGIPP